MEEKDYMPLPPRRMKHGSSKPAEEALLAEPEGDEPQKNQSQPHSFHAMQQELNSRLERRKALKEFTLNPQGFMQKNLSNETKKKPKTKVPKKQRRWSGGLIIANIILSLFLCLIVGIFFMIFYKF